MVKPSSSFSVLFPFRSLFIASFLRAALIAPSAMPRLLML